MGVYMLCIRIILFNPQNQFKYQPKRCNRYKFESKINFLLKNIVLEEKKL